MTPVLVHQRCWHHPMREAASRCPGCRRFFCRECVTEHGGRVLCRQCLTAQGAAQLRGGSLAAVWWTLGATAGLVFTWNMFYYFGALLARMPAQFHGGAP